ncbi:hypothetical protein [Sphingomonas psychrotolerans]|uniref:hypothetical protein n=1 Tax=Sphingomonas psychrotolerans TaxID=1327635 RepID=UPI001305230A|nr:hypothetical protein [Sphingomonas psychrotolerans]
MRFTDDTADIPDRLIALQEKGEVVFLCGAGISQRYGFHHSTTSPPMFTTSSVNPGWAIYNAHIAPVPIWVLDAKQPLPKNAAIAGAPDQTDICAKVRDRPKL